LIDRAAARVLRTNSLLGFLRTLLLIRRTRKIVNSLEHQRLALKAAHETIVLLKNESHLLPLDKSKYKRVAVIGPNAAELHLAATATSRGAA